MLVNGVSYEISMTGDWNSNSVQLTADYVGETNFDVSIIIPTASFSPKRKKGGTAKDGALSHASLVQSMEQLNSITEAFNVKLKLQDDSIGKPSKNLKSHRPRAPSKPKTIQMASVDTTGSESTNTKMPYLRPKSSKRTVQNTAAQTANVVEEDAYGDVQQKPEVIKPATLKPVKFTAGSEQSKPAFPTSAHLGRSEPTNRLDDNKKSGAPAPSVHRQQKGTSTGPRGESTEAAQDTQPCSAATAVASVATTEKTIDEQRKAAALRVQRKLKEEQARIEKIEAAKAEALRLQQEASAAKAKELQARTALRVGKYVEENQRRAEQQKQAELYEQQQREQRNQEFFNSSRHAKMKEYRKAARNRFVRLIGVFIVNLLVHSNSMRIGYCFHVMSACRLELIAQADYRKAVEEEESVQKKLFEIHKKYEANTTFLPRLDAQSQVSGAGSGVGVIDEKKMKPGVVVKSIGVELEQFERESGKFPEEPVLRSRSARQASRISKAGAAAAVGGCPAISAQYRQNSVPSVPTVINKTLASRYTSLQFCRKLFLIMLSNVFFVLCRSCLLVVQRQMTTTGPTTSPILCCGARRTS